MGAEAGAEIAHPAFNLFALDLTNLGRANAASL